MSILYIVTQIEVSICTTGLSCLKLVSNYIYITYVHKFTCVYVYIYTYLSMEAAYLIWESVSWVMMHAKTSSHWAKHLAQVQILKITLVTSKSHHMTRYHLQITVVSPIQIRWTDN